MLHADGGTGQHVVAGFPEVIRAGAHIKSQLAGGWEGLGAMGAGPEDTHGRMQKSVPSVPGNLITFLACTWYMLHRHTCMQNTHIQF